MESSELSTKSIMIWVGAALVITAVLVGVFKLAGSGNGNGGTNPVVTNLPPVSESDWTRGATSTSLTLIEYSDFQCPACGLYHPVVEQVVENEAKSLRFVYRNFPLSQHANAEPAARAAGAAGKQGKFWDMYHLIFENQSEWSEKSTTEASKIFESYATKLGLKLAQYRADYDSSEIKDKIKNDYQGGISAGVNATPTFFLNGRKLQNPPSYDSFKKIIDDAIANGL